MKLKAIEIIGFGKWQQQTIDFAENNQLLFGMNEAGKSTIYQFIQAMLFGFPTKGKRKKEYQPKNGASYGGRLWFIHPVYGEVQVERFKAHNKGQAKVFFNEQVGDESMLEKMLSPLTRDLFQHVFTFQQEQLSQLENINEESLQTSLLSLGVSGSQELLVNREAYFKEAQTIYKGKGSQPPLNQLLTEYQELQKRVIEKEQQERPFQALVEKLTEIEQEIIAKKIVVREQKKQLLLIEKQVMNKPLYEELQSIQQEGSKSILEAKDQEQLLSIYQQSRFLSEELTRLNKELALQSDTQEQTEEYHFYLEEEASIQQLLNQRYGIEKLLTELQWMEQSFKQNQQEMMPLEKQWNWQVDKMPKLPFDEQEVIELREAMIARTIKLQKAETDLRLLEEEITTREENLSTFESLNKEMFQKNHRKKKKAPNLLFIVAGLVIIIFSFLLTAPIRYVAVILGLIAVIIGVFPLFYQSKELYEHEKRQWQEKLSQLDYLNDQLNQLKKEITTIHEAERKQNQLIAKKVRENNLGKMDQVDYWLNHRGDITRYLILVNTNQELQHQLKESREQVVEIVKQTERLATRLPIAGTSLAERIHIINQFADRMEKVRFAQEYQADAYTRQTIRELKEKQQQLLDSANPLLQRFQIISVNEIPEKLKLYQEASANQKRKIELEQMIAGLYDSTMDITKLPAAQQELTNQINDLEETIQQLQKTEQKLLYQKQQMLSDGTLDELYQKQAIVKAKVEELALDWSSSQLAGQLLMDFLTELSEQQLPNLLKKATAYFQLLTDQSYQGLQLQEGQLIAVKKDQQRFMLHELSTGTRDQVVMAVRFAFLYLQEPRNLCPIIIDDGWLHYDSQRKKQLAQLFAVFAQQQQVICFSSDQEMVSYYKELKQPIIQLEGA